jgi:hypothetical protein
MNNIARPLIYISNTKKFSILRRKIVILRTFLSRAYQWVHVPGMILMMAGVMYPYIKPYTDVNMFILATLVFIGLFVIGFIERYLGFYSEDVNYNTENNRLLLKRLKELEDKIDLLTKKDGDGQKDRCNVQSERT